MAFAAVALSVNWIYQVYRKPAELFFFHGNIARARYRQLAGDDAVFQLFQSPIEGEFSFTGRDVREEDVQTEISMPAISLLMESVRMSDELPMLKERLPNEERVFLQKAGQLAQAQPRFAGNVTGLPGAAFRSQPARS